MTMLKNKIVMLVFIVLLLSSCERAFFVEEQLACEVSSEGLIEILMAQGLHLSENIDHGVESETSRCFSVYDPKWYSGDVLFCTRDIGPRKSHIYMYAYGRGTKDYERGLLGLMMVNDKVRSLTWSEGDILCGNEATQ